MLTSFQLATSYPLRLKGLLFSRPHAGLVMLCPCKSVHTFGMRHALDIAFVDETGTVLESFRGVGHAVFLRNRKARMVLERFANKEPWYVKGEKIFLKNADLYEEGEML